jgi:hypothetical protein
VRACLFLRKMKRMTKRMRPFCGTVQRERESERASERASEREIERGRELYSAMKLVPPL